LKQTIFKPTRVKYYKTTG